MEKEVLEALINRWRKDSVSPKIKEAVDRDIHITIDIDGFRKGQQVCADDRKV